MNNYDDLQRFKDKTHTQQHDFKDFSSQNLAHDYGNWAIINQLSPATEESALAMGGHVSLPVPQSVDADTFALKEQPFAAPAALAPAQLPDAAPAIFQSVAAQLATPPAAGSRTRCARRRRTRKFLAAFCAQSRRGEARR